MPRAFNPKSCEPIDAYIGKQMRALRRARDWTQADLGHKVGITYQQVQKYESGANRVTVGRLVAVAKALKEPLGAFLPEGVAL